MQGVDVAPSVNLLESMRSVGYSFAAALADLIDNSISAGATRIDIDADVLEGKFVTILDNGRGMNPMTALEALRLAGVSGIREREDLGRFGLGLKTASLSQARSVTVATRMNNATTVLRWDIDHVLESGRWSLLMLDETDASTLPSWSDFNQQKNGTLVIWQHLDLLLGDTSEPGSHLRNELVKARDELALVFHRFLSGSSNGLLIKFNGAVVQPVDPFLESNSHTQISPIEEIRIGDGVVEVTAFTLPHPTGLTPTERVRTDLSSGMREAQGFYIYRNRRLIAHGGWYGLAIKSELTKQTRIRVDLPNSLDGLWQLDIKKSRVEPPSSFKARLKRIIDPLLDRGRRVHTFRGRRESEISLIRVWEKLVDRNSKVSYVINPEHPLLAVLRSSLPPDQSNLLDSAFELIGSNFPLRDLYVVMANNGIAMEDAPQQEAVLSKLHLLQLAGVLGESSSEATAQLAMIEPFNQVKNLHELVVRTMEAANNGSE